jgi:CubicO group peptidase (beta-lactamase class C family)
MTRRILSVTLLASILLGVGLVGQTQKPATPRSVVAAPQAAPVYFPPRLEWERRKPDEVGLDATRLQQAIDFAMANENPATKDLALDLELTFGMREPLFKILGPTKPRTGMNGLVIRKGFVVAEWGDTARADMTFSVTKTFLSTTIGLAWQRGLIRDVTDRAKDYVPTPELFESEHNAKITWEHLLRQTSDWSGTLWDIPDWADRPEGKTPADYPNRPMREPGTFYKYNDVRVNLLALCALHVWRRPLPQVLREDVMDPIGASSTWRWHAYDNAWVTIDGQKMQSVTGGGHFGGGMIINAWDMARFGYLFLRNGKWKDRQIVSEKWIAMARTGGPANAEYGYMNWFLNPGRKSLPSAPESSVTFRGNGQNIIYIDWENDLVVVVRWIGGGRALDQFLGQVVGAATK